MNVNFMRSVDRLLGPLACFCLSEVRCLTRLWPFGRKDPALTGRKILFVKFSEIGAIILAYPFLKSVREKYPDAELFFLTFASSRPVFGLLDNVVPSQNVLTVREKSPHFFVADTLAAVRKLRRLKIDVIFDLEFFSRFSALVAGLVDAPVKAGFYGYHFEGLYRGGFWTHRIQYNPQNHISRTYLSMLQVLDRPRKHSPELARNVDEQLPAFPHYVSDPAARAAVLTKLTAAGAARQHKLVLVNPGEGVLPQREWPLEYFIDLCKQLLTDREIFIATVGTEGGAKKSWALLQALKSDRCANLVGQTTMPELMELLTMAEFLVTNDCGLGHLSMLTGIRKFIFFGAETPRVFGPVGKNVHLLYSGWPCSPWFCPCMRARWI